MAKAQLTKPQEKALLVMRDATYPIHISTGRYAVIAPATGLALHKKGLAYLRSDRSIRLTDEGAVVAATLENPADWKWDDA